MPRRRKAPIIEFETGPTAYEADTLLRGGDILPLPKRKPNLDAAVTAYIQANFGEKPSRRLFRYLVATNKFSNPRFLAAYLVERPAQIGADLTPYYNDIVAWLDARQMDLDIVVVDAPTKSVVRYFFPDSWTVDQFGVLVMPGDIVGIDGELCHVHSVTRGTNEYKKIKAKILASVTSNPGGFTECHPDLCIKLATRKTVTSEFKRCSKDSWVYIPIYDEKDTISGYAPIAVTCIGTFDEFSLVEANYKQLAAMRAKGINHPNSFWVHSFELFYAKPTSIECRPLSEALHPILGPCRISEYSQLTHDYFYPSQLLFQNYVRNITFQEAVSLIQIE